MQLGWDSVELSWVCSLNLGAQFRKDIMLSLCLYPVDCGWLNTVLITKSCETPIFRSDNVIILSMSEYCKLQCKMVDCWVSILLLWWCYTFNNFDFDVYVLRVAMYALSLVIVKVVTCKLFSHWIQRCDPLIVFPLMIYTSILPPFTCCIGPTL